MKASQTMFSLLTGRVPPFEEALNWLKFTYTVDQMESYMALASTVLVQFVVLEVDPLF